jgi:hypothetical protein
VYSLRRSDGQPERGADECPLSPALHTCTIMSRSSRDVTGKYATLSHRRALQASHERRLLLRNALAEILLVLTQRPDDSARSRREKAGVRRCRRWYVISSVMVVGTHVSQLLRGVNGSSDDLIGCSEGRTISLTPPSSIVTSAVPHGRQTRCPSWRGEPTECQVGLNRFMQRDRVFG